MDILAHGLWAGVGLAAVGRGRPLSRRAVIGTVALAVAPDLAHLLPLLWLAATQPDGLALLRGYVVATPATEPLLPPAVAAVAHHLHCLLHSAVVALPVSALLLAVSRAMWLPLAGWWSHIVIDVFTHSAEFYPSPVLYPFTQRGFDGVAWNAPTFMGLNYAALALAGLVVWHWRCARRR